MNYPISKSIFFFSFIFFVSFSFSQSADDLSYLNLLPNNQAQSIAERLGIQTGKPIDDEVIIDTFDEPKFSSSIPKTEIEETINFFPSKLERFGFSFFNSSPNTFAPIDLAPAPLGYVLGPGDELRIQYYGNDSSNRLVKVNREGNVVLPDIGIIQSSGITFNELKSKIEDLVEASLIGTKVEVSLSKVRSIQVFVLGNAETPGSYTISSLSNISNILFFSGGPSANGSLRKIDLKRNGQLVGSFDFYDLLVKGNTSTDLKMLSNDAIVINPVGKTVSIYGQVKNNAIFELKNDENFKDLLNYASGFSTNANKNRITLSRLATNGERIYQNLNYLTLNENPLKDGDEIFVHALPNTPRNIIRIVGETTSAGSYAFDDSMTLNDVIYPESFLDTTYTLFAVIERENEFGSKFLVKANLLNNLKDIPLKKNDVIYVLSKKDIEFLNSILVADALGLLTQKDSDSLSDYFSNSGLDRYQCKSLKLLAKQSESTSIKFVKSKYFPNPKIKPLDQLEFVKECPKIFESKPYLAIFSLENATVISGEVRRPGVYPSYLISSPRDLLSFAGGASEKSSGMIDIFTDDGVSLKIDNKEKNILSELGIKSGFYMNLLSSSESDIFSVSLEGAFISPGIYGVKQGEKISDVLKRAGGFKKNAYPYGGVLARKSVAEKEKLAFIKSADQLEESIATAISSGRISSVGGDPTLALSSISRLITNLEKIDPIGRVVTEFDIDLLERSPQKDLLLERGDRIFVPERPSTITVSGQVLSPTSFSFDPSLKVNDYINLAGGYSEDADKNRTLIIYPNGRASRVKNWPNSPNLSPGTTLIVPRDPNPFDWLVFSQVLFPIISNFATSAAAIAALGNNN